MPELKDNVEERLKGLQGIECWSCLDSGFIHEWMNGDWRLKYEKTGDLTDGQEAIRLIKCDHGKDLGF